MTTHQLLLLPGDGIGAEVMAEVERVLAFFNAKSRRGRFEAGADLVGGASLDRYGVPLTDTALARAKQAGCVLFGAVGGPKWDAVPYDKRPEAGLLRLRK